MYALEDLLNTRGEDSVTSGPRVRVRRPRVNTQGCEVKDLAIEKGKKPSHKKRKRKQVYPPNIETKIHQTRVQVKKYPVILPLFKKLCGTPEEDIITDEPGQSNHHCPRTVLNQH